MTTIDQPLLKLFLNLAGERLTGQWIIIGGAVLALKGHAYRITNDIDIAPPKKASQEQILKLLEIAEQLGLPVEAINQAAAFFLNKIKNWKDDLVKVHQGKNATFYCPNTTLFLLLKIQRLSETDLNDCLKMLELREDATIDIKRLEQALKLNLKNNLEQEKRIRFEKLLAAILRYESRVIVY